MDFSFDGRWLISAHHGDPLIKTWDIVDSKVVITRNTGDEIELGMRTDEEEFVDQECTDDPPSEESVEHV
ncbi:unnamed protein product, partial [Trichobilharzia regenti]